MTHFHPLKGTITNLYTVTYPAFSSQDMTVYLVLSAFTSSQNLHTHLL